MESERRGEQRKGKERKGKERKGKERSHFTYTLEVFLLTACKHLAFLLEQEKREDHLPVSKERRQPVHTWLESSAHRCFSTEAIFHMHKYTQLGKWPRVKDREKENTRQLLSLLLPLALSQQTTPDRSICCLSMLQEHFSLPCDLYFRALALPSRRSRDLFSPQFTQQMYLRVLCISFLPTEECINSKYTGTTDRQGHKG